MDLPIYEATKNFVIESFEKANRSHEINHFLRTPEWLKILKPDADDALLAAAVAHDIERAYRQKDVLEKKNTLGFTDINFYRPHEERGAEIIADFLKNEKADSVFIERVRMLISRHEEGGTEDQNLLKDADSLSFFENNSDHFGNKFKEIGKDKVKQKFDWMYERITMDRAKEFARPYYERAISDLNGK